MTSSKRILAASLSGKDVYVTGGEFGRVETAGGVDIYGGYLATTWQRRLDARTRIAGTPEAVLATGDTQSSSSSSPSSAVPASRPAPAPTGSARSAARGSRCSA